MGKAMAEPLERVARALCRADGHPENIKFEGKPMWASYTEEATMVLAELKADVIVEALALVIAGDGVPEAMREKAQHALKSYRTGNFR